MNVSREEILDIIYASLDEVNEQLGTEGRILKSEGTVLLSDSGKLDSLGFVNFVALLEEKCEGAFGATLSLTGDNAALDEKNPFETVGKLADFIRVLLTREQGE
jgi:acyl carrier protein